MGRGYRIVIDTPRGTHAFECGEEEYVLEAAERSGVQLPYICRQGRCLTCAGRLIEGTADQSRADTFFPEDSAAGFILLCRALPRSDLRITTHQDEAMRAHRLAHGLPAPYA